MTRAPAASMLLLLALACSRPAAAAGPAAEYGKPPVLGTNTQCRYAPTTTHDFCALPIYLGNFQGNFQCAPGVKIGRPVSVEQAQALVTMFDHAKASGTGDSWWKEQFCAGNDSTAINIVMTEITPVVDFITKPVTPAHFLNATIPADFPIKVDETARTVTVAAGVPQRMLLDYLSEYTHWHQPKGWTLPAFTWFLDQTIGGAVSTASHGSSMRWGSLSSQVRGFKIILANGTLLELASPNSSPEAAHLWRAVGVSVGRLGVLSELTMRIVPQQAVTRKLQNITFSDLVQQIKGTQDAYNAALAANDPAAVQKALFQVDEAQTFWHVPRNVIWRTDYEHLDHEPANLLPNIDHSQPQVMAMEGPSDAVFDQIKKPGVAPSAEMGADISQTGGDNALYWSSFYIDMLSSIVAPGTFPSRKSYVSTTEVVTFTTSTFTPYDQYEVAVPLEVAGSCLEKLNASVYGPDKLWQGFRTPALIRFVSGEDFYISHTNGGPRMFINLEDYVSRSSDKPNTKFSAVVDLMLKECRGRLHWGKAGWPAHQPCFDGAAAYPKTWCDFGCAVAQLDPAGKFHGAGVGETDVWRWNATKGGVEVPLTSCCTAQGFSKECQCASAACVAAAPPAPLVVSAANRP